MIVLIIGAVSDRRRRRKASQAKQVAAIQEQRAKNIARLKFYGPENGVVKVSYPNPATSDLSDIKEFLDNEDRMFILNHYQEEAYNRDAPAEVLRIIQERKDEVFYNS